MLLEMAIADSYGAGFEFIPLKEVKAKNTLKRYIQNQKHKNLKLGCYTDDTQMSIALAELLLEKDYNAWTHMDVANKFVEVSRRDPRPGYAGAFYDLLKEVKDGQEFLSRVRPHSDKSGGAMRAGVLGLIPDIPTVIDRAMMQASLTHATREGMIAAAASALMVHYCYYRVDFSNRLLADFLETHLHLRDTFCKPWRAPVGASGMDAVRAACWTVRMTDSASEILRNIVYLTGDTDTAAAIAMMPASVCEQIEQDLPQVLYDKLENGAYGRDFLVSLDEKLMDKFDISKGPKYKHCSLGTEVLLRGDNEIDLDALLSQESPKE